MRHADVIVVGAGPAGIAAATAAARHGRSVLLLDDNPAAGGQIWRGGIEAPIQRANRGENAQKEHGTPQPRLVRSSPSRRLSRLRCTSPAHTVRTSRNCRRCRGGRPSIRPTHSGDRSARALLALSRLDSPRRLWSGGLAGPGQGRLPCPRQARRRRGLRPASVGRGRASPRVRSARDQCRGTGPDVAARALRCLALVASRKAPAGHRLPRCSWKCSIPYRLLAGRGSRETKLPACSRASDSPTERRHGTSHATCSRAAFTLYPTPSSPLCWAAIFAATSLQSTSNSRPPSRMSTAPESRPESPASTQLSCRARSRDWPAPGRRPNHCALATLRNKNLPHAWRPHFVCGPNSARSLHSETIVCRCEDVTYGDLSSRTGWTDAKLQTRCGMGPCQGRICGPATQTLFGWTPKSIRPPLFPVPVSALCFHDSQHDVPKENA